MDATRWTPRIGAACAALLLLVLVVPADARAASTVNFANGSLMHYSDVAGVDDRVQVTFGQHDEEPAFQFVPLNSVDLVGTNGCTDDHETPDAIACPDHATSFLFQLGGGSDFVDLFALTGADRRPSAVDGGPGNDELRGTTLADEFSGGPGDDTFAVVGPDVYAGGDGIDTVGYEAGGPWTVSLDGVINDGAQSNAVANVLGDVEVLLGGPLGDRFNGTTGAQTLDGRGGGDTLDGGPDPDDVRGGEGDDTITARDGAVDAIACGGGTDAVTADWNDLVESDCETVDRAARDDDGDGSPHGIDCDDANATIEPGAGDVPGNGVDEDCDGSDAVLDRDGDGAAAGADCDDANPARRPGAVDVPANGIDEDCSGRDARRPVVAATFSSGWSVFTRYTTLTRLEVKGAPAGAKLQVRCTGKGCPFARKAVKLRKGGAKLTRLFKAKRLRPGAVVELRVTAPGSVGKVQRLKIRKRRDPKRSSLCLPPGASKPSRCG